MNVPISVSPVAAAMTVSPPTTLRGELIAEPKTFTVMRHGAVMLQGADGTTCWQGANGSPLLPDISAVRELLGLLRYEIVPETNEIRPTNQNQEPPKPEPAPALVPLTLLPIPTLAPEQEAPVWMLAHAMPCTAPGDQIDVNRLALANAAWVWMIENRTLLAPFLAPPPPPPPPPSPAPPVYKGGPAQPLHSRQAVPAKGRR